MRKFPLLWQVTPHFNSLVSSTCQFDASFPHKRPLLFSSPQICHFHTNLSILQKSINSMQICQFQTNPSVPHKSVCSTQRWNDAYQWGICVEVTCGSNRFVCKWRICVQLTDLCGTDGLVLNWRILGAEKESPLCVSNVLNWRVCWSEGYSLCHTLITFLEIEFDGSSSSRSLSWLAPSIKRHEILSRPKWGQNRPSASRDSPKSDRSRQRITWMERLFSSRLRFSGSELWI